MAISILPCVDADMPPCFDIMSRSFAHDSPFVDAFYPAHETPHGQEIGIKRFLKWKNSSPSSSTWLKAVVQNENDNNKEQIIGLAVWNLVQHDKNPPPLELEKIEDAKSVWPDDEDREFMGLLWKGLAVPRRQAVLEAGEKGLWLLELLAVDPNFHRRGAGVALVQWGTKMADEQGVDAILEATPIGRRTYEKCGFQGVIEGMKFDTGDKFPDRKTPPLVFMRRTAKT